MLGGSELAIAVGLVPWHSPIRLWLELVRDEQPPESDAQRIARRLRLPMLLELETRGYYASSDDAFGMPLRAPPWLADEPDAAWLGDEAVGPLPVTLEPAAQHRGELAPWWEARLQALLHLTDAPAGLVAHLGGLTFEIWEVDRDERAIALLLELGERFVAYVRSGEQPPPGGHPDDRAALLAVHPAATAGKRARETREVRAARLELARLLEREKVAKARAEHLRALITSHIGDAETLVSLHDEPVAAWRNVSTTRLDTARLKRERPDVYATYSATSDARRLTLE